jgi:PEP-CTERM motif-containing protein
MSKRRQNLVVVFAAIMLSAFVNANAHAAINIANGAPIVGGSGAYPAFQFNDPSAAPFETWNVTDGQNASPDNDTGSITEPDQGGSYWLGTFGAQSGYFVLDLGASYNISQVELFNTRNARFDDRGTGDFRIVASNALTPGAPGTGMNLLGGVQIVAGTLTPQTYSGSFSFNIPDPLVPDWFSTSSSGPFRYLRFEALSVGAANDRGFPTNAGVGLNEIRVFEGIASTPEPASMIVLGFVGTLGFFLRRRFSDALESGR